MSKLAIAAGGHSHSVPTAGWLSIGRAPQCDIEIDSPAVSRFHARIGIAQGKLVVVDVGSRNGVIVNGSRVAGTQFLQLGDVINIGGQTLTVVDAGRGPERQPSLVPRSTPSVALRRTDAMSSVYDVYLQTLTESLATGAQDQGIRAAKHLCEALDATENGATAREHVDRITDALVRLSIATGDSTWIDRLLWTRRKLELPLDTSRVEEIAARLWELRAAPDPGRRAYVEWMRARAVRVADRVALKRLEDATPRAE